MNGAMSDEDIARRIAWLRQELVELDEAYYRRAESPVGDQQYDELKHELADLEKRHGDLEKQFPDLLSTPSPSSRVGDDRQPGFETVPHLVPMLSLDNTYSEAEVREFDSRLARLLGGSRRRYLVEPKVDGMAISLVYEHGQLVRAVTRGNGLEGDVVTANIAEACAGLPKTLPAEAPQRLELRGEVYMTFDEFRRINAERETAGLPLFANPRNLAAGTVKQLDGVQGRRLEVVVHGVGACEPAGFERLSQWHAALARWGLPGQDRLWEVDGIEAALEAIRALDELRLAMPYPTDGAVVKLDALSEQTLAGWTSKAPRWAMAYKFAAEQAETQLREITVQVGRTGVLTPVANLEPVRLAGTTVARATLHNEDEIRRKDIRPGDTVVVQKAGEIIPQVVRVVLEKRPPESKPFEFPVLLDSCGFEAERREGEAVWRLKQGGSGEQLKRQICHFASRQAMDIDHCGEAVVGQLVDRQLVHDIADLYKLEVASFETLEKFGKRSAQNLASAIAASKGNPLWRLIHGLGIPNVGARLSKDLAAQFRSIDALSKATIDDLLQIDGVGEIVAASVHSFLTDPLKLDLIERLRAAGLRLEDAEEADQTPRKKTAAAVAGKRFVLTGTLPNWDRETAKAAIESAGGRVVSSVSQQTDFLVAGEKAGSKLEKANSLGITVLDEAGLQELLGRL